MTTHSYANGNGNENDERKRMVLKYNTWLKKKRASKESNNHSIDYNKWMNNHDNSNFHKDDFVMIKDEGVHGILNSDNEIDYPLNITDLYFEMDDPYADSLDSGDALLDGVPFDEDDYPAYEVVPYGTDDGDYDPGEGAIRSLRGNVPNRQLMQRCTRSKKVTLHKFCVDGKHDAGSHGEHRFSIDGSWLNEDEIDIRENACTDLRSRTLSKVVPGRWQSLSVGTEEIDGWSSGNDSAFETIPGNQWYTNTCDTYEIRLNKEFDEEKKHMVCVDATMSANFAVIESEVKVQTCSEWIERAESFTFFLQVEPLELPVWKKIHNIRHWHWVMDLHQGNAKPWQPVNLISDRNHYTENAQYWYMDVMGRIKSRSNTQYCLEGGINGDLWRPMYLHYCHDGEWQQWTHESSQGRLRNKWHGKYIGVKYCASNGNDNKGRLELQHYFGDTSNCGKAQKWNMWNE